MGRRKREKMIVTNGHPATQPNSKHPTLNHATFLHSFRDSRAETEV